MWRLKRGCRESRIASALGADWKGKVSLALYLADIALAFVNEWLAYALCLTFTVMWFIPDRRMVRVVGAREGK